VAAAWCRKSCPGTWLSVPAAVKPGRATQPDTAMTLETDEGWPSADLAVLGTDAAFGYAFRVELRGLEPLTPSIEQHE
jgi:hypothetical protein